MLRRAVRYIMVDVTEILAGSVIRAIIAMTVSMYESTRCQFLEDNHLQLIFVKIGNRHLRE